MGVTISYNNSNIATIDASEAVLLNTGQKYCVDNITIAYTDTFIRDLIYKNYPTGDIYIEADENFPMKAIVGWTASSLTLDMKTYTFITSWSDSYAFKANKISKFHIIYNNNSNLGRYLFTDHSYIPFVIVIEGTSTAGYNDSCFRANNKLTCLDINLPGSMGTNSFYGDTSLTTIILRSKTIIPLGGTGSFTNTPFASNGSGGTIYIPKLLYEHLDDGTSLDYKAATNWSTINGYGKTTWAQIEGSQYENYYADGTPVSTGGKS